MAYILIAAQSGRALAAAARSCGYAPLVVDLFADDDTRAIAIDARAVHALTPGHLLPALEAMAAGRNPIGVVCGSGFEDNAAVLDMIERAHGLIGNSADTVRRSKDPLVFAALCRSLGIPHPEIALEGATSGPWLEKAIGGAGGLHITRARENTAVPAGRYRQRHAAGTPVGALFLADGATARIVDISAQWTDPVQSRAFRYGGAARPAMLAPAVTEGLARAIAALVPALGLRGLNSADALVRADGFDLLEINPRPGATLDMYADLPLFAAHVATAQGTRPDTLPEATLGRTLPPGGRAVAVAYARRDMVLPRGFVWPAWTADRQSAGVAIDAGEPFCTTHARAADAGAARALVTARVAAIVELAELAQPEDALA